MRPAGAAVWRRAVAGARALGRPGFRSAASVYIHILLLVLIGALLVLQANAINQVRSTFCSWSRVQVQALREMPRSPERDLHLREDSQLARKVCG